MPRRPKPSAIAMPVIVSIIALAWMATGRVARAGEHRYLAAGDPGRTLCGPAPAGWERPEFDDGAWSAAMPDGGITRLAPPGPPDGGTAPCPALRMRRRFSTGPERRRLAALTLRVRYQDGFVAWLNGVEIARRRIEPGAEWATETKGSERETVVVEVPRELVRATDNVLALEARPAKSTRRPIVDVELWGSDGPRIRRGPYLQRVGTGEGWVVIETDLPTTARLRYAKLGTSLDGAGSAGEGGTTPSLRHVLRFPKLRADTAYRYRIELAAAPSGAGAANGLIAGDGSHTTHAAVTGNGSHAVKGSDAGIGSHAANGSNASGTIASNPANAPLVAEGEFHTPPPAGRPLRFVVFGDVRSGHEEHARLARAIVGEDPDLVLMTGDMVDRGSDEAEWERYFEVAAPMLRQVTIYPAPGNHDNASRPRGAERFLSLFLRDRPTPWWSFDVAGAHFALLDSDAYGDPAQLAWLDEDLAQARRRKARALFVLVHHGPFSSGQHGDNRLAIRDYVPVMERHRVSAMFSGHDHHYERLRVGGIDYIISGGGGAELRRARCGVPGRRRCPPRSKVFVNEHHYVVVELKRDRMRVCPKRADGTLLEACPTLSVRR